MSKHRMLLWIVALLLMVIVLLPVLTVQATGDLFPVNKEANCDYVEMRTPNNSQEDVLISGQLNIVAYPGSVLKSGEVLTQEETVFLAGMPSDPSFQQTAPGAWNGPTGSPLNDFLYLHGHVEGWIKVHSLEGELLDEEVWTSDQFECGENPYPEPEECSKDLAVGEFLSHTHARLTWNGTDECVAAFVAYDTEGFGSLDDPGAYQTLLVGPVNGIVSQSNKVINLHLPDYEECKVQLDLIIAPKGTDLGPIFPQTLTKQNQGPQWEHLVKAETRGFEDCESTPTPTSTMTPTLTPSVTASATTIPSSTPTLTPTPTASSTPTVTPTPTNTSDIFTATPTHTSEPTVTPSVTATSTPIMVGCISVSVQYNFTRQTVKGETQGKGSEWTLYDSKGITLTSGTAISNTFEAVAIDWKGMEIRWSQSGIQSEPYCRFAPDNAYFPLINNVIPTVTPTPLPTSTAQPTATPVPVCSTRQLAVTYQNETKVLNFETVVSTGYDMGVLRIDNAVTVKTVDGLRLDEVYRSISTNYTRITSDSPWIINTTGKGDTTEKVDTRTQYIFTFVYYDQGIRCVVVINLQYDPPEPEPTSSTEVASVSVDTFIYIEPWSGIERTLNRVPMFP